MSDTVAQAYAALQQQLAAKPGEYSSTWQGQTNDLIDRILNREEFSYDVNSDALYQQYKDQYASLGKLAMQDAMGQAAAMTGGYGSSYASTAGNQAYQSYLSQLNEVVPELYGMARDQYNQEGQELYNQYALLSDQESQDYGRYVDKYNQWANEVGISQGLYDDAYGEYRDTIADQQWETTLDYQKDRDKVADEQWEKNYQLNANADNRAAEAWKLEKEAYETAKAEGNTEVALQHVASLSPEDLTEALKSYSYDEDNKGLATFLDDCVAAGRLTDKQADEYYKRYRTGTDDDGVTDTTVKPNYSMGGVSIYKPSMMENFKA